jgi:polyisoprenoid-binding protein YceI
MVLALAATGLQAAEWQIDAPHSSVQFKVSHLVISKVVGSFTDFSGKLSFDGKDVSGGSIQMTIQVASIDTDNADRDGHLTSPDFFEAEKYPEMSFKSKSVSKAEGGKFGLTGDLTIKGVTKEITFDCEFHGSVDFMGTSKAGFSAETTIDRQDFGLSWSRALETGGLVVGNEVEISLELEFNQDK